MRRLIGLLGSIGVGLLVTAAGLALDANTLTYAGIAILALMLALALWSWGHSDPLSAGPSLGRPLALDDSPPPSDLSDKDKALFVLKRARDNAVVARKMKGDEAARSAYHEIVAACLTAKREFGVGALKLTGSGTIPFKDALEAYVAFVDRIYPLLREGHVNDAKSKAGTFKWSWGEE